MQAGFKGAGVPSALATLRGVVASGLAAPPALVAELAELAADAGLCASGGWIEGSKQWRSVWGAICQVRPFAAASVCSRQAHAQGVAG